MLVGFWLLICCQWLYLTVDTLSVVVFDCWYTVSGWFWLLIYCQWLYLTVDIPSVVDFDCWYAVSGWFWLLIRCQCLYKVCTYLYTIFLSSIDISNLKVKWAFNYSSSFHINKDRTRSIQPSRSVGWLPWSVARPDIMVPELCHFFEILIISIYPYITWQSMDRWYTHHNLL